MRIIVGADHGGVELKQLIVKYLRDKGHQVEDVGTHSAEPVDYPTYAIQVAGAVRNYRVERGILVCGSGIGMCITANRVPGVRAALVYEPYGAKMSRKHNDSNILCLGGRFIGRDLAIEIVDTWLKTPFDGGRHKRRIDLIDELVHKYVQS